MKKNRILYIEDNEQQRNAFSESLLKRGFSVDVASCGEDGIARLIKKQPDVVLCDLNMPGMNGLEVLNQVQQINSEIAFIILTSRGSVPLAVKAMRQGAYDFILKPPAIEQIEAKIKQAIEKIESLRKAKLELDKKARELKKTTYLLGNANVKLLAAQEQLEQKNIEMQKLLQELSKSRDELQTILDAAPNAIIMVDADDNIVAANKCLDSFFGIQVEAVLHKPFELFLEKISDCFEDFDRFRDVADIMHISIDRFLVKDFDPAQFYECGVQIIKPKPRIIIPINTTVTDQNKTETGKIWFFSDITAFKQADEQLRTIVNASPIPLIVSRLSDGKILFVNEHLTSLLGLNAKSLLGNITPDYYCYPDDRKKIVDKIKQNGFINSREVLINKPDGTPIWVLLSVETTKIGGELVALSGLYDINERKLAEEALKRERNFVSAVIDTASALVIVLDTQGRFLRFNRACEQVTGYTFAEVKGKPFWDIFLIPEEVDHVKAKFNELCAGRFPNRGDNYWVTKAGKRRLIAWSNTALPDNAGSVEYIVSTGIDITRHRQTQDALQKSEQNYRELVESSNSIILRWNRNGNITFFNEFAQRFFGYSEAEILGKNIIGTIVPEKDSSGLDLRIQMEEIEQNPENHISNENENIKRNGERVWITWANKPLFDDAGNVREILSIGNDMTERKKVMNDLAKANRNLRETQAQLVQSEKMASLGNLVAGIAHEINTPIGAVHSMHNTLMRAVKKLKITLESEFPDVCKENSEFRRIFKIIEQADNVIDSGTDRVTNIIQRLRSFARLDEAELKTVDIHEGLDDTLLLMQHEIKQQIKVIKNYGEIPPVACYPGQLNQIFLNILMNAKHAIKGTGEITITTFTKNNNVHAAIRDNGVGIERENIKKVFDPGFTTKGVGVGTGLGLSICYKIIQAHYGEIKVESQLGKGSTFTVIFPANLDEIFEHT